MARATVPISARLDLNTRMMVGPLDDGIDRRLVCDVVVLWAVDDSLSLRLTEIANVLRTVNPSFAPNQRE
jgi:hypothetical protein